MAKLSTSLIWGVGGVLPRWLTEAVIRIVAPLAARRDLPGVAAWAETMLVATGTNVTRSDRTELIGNWIRNNLWSLSLARWTGPEVLKRALPAEGMLETMRTALRGPGLVLALPHMGSWDLAGAWCAANGMPVVSVAERLPDGLYERFSKARAGMGIAIYPTDQPDLMRHLADDVRAGKLVCLLADRDLSGRGVSVPWPGSSKSLSVPVGPALLARRTGAELRVVGLAFEGGRMHLTISEPVSGASTREVLSHMVCEFANAVRKAPTSWLMLRRPFR